MIFLLPQFPSVVVTGHVLRELKQVSAGGECPSRPWRARAKSDLQLRGPENAATLPPTCQGARALSGVLWRLQQVEEKILQVTASLSALPLPPPMSGVPAFPPSLLLPRAGSSSDPSLPLFCPARCSGCDKPTWPPPASPPEGALTSLSLLLFFSFFFLTLTAEEGSELGQQGISQKEH